MFHLDDAGILRTQTTPLGRVGCNCWHRRIQGQVVGIEAQHRHGVFGGAAGDGGGDHHLPLGSGENFPEDSMLTNEDRLTSSPRVHQQVHW